MASNRRRNDPPEAFALRIACVFVAALAFLALKAGGVSQGYAILVGVGAFLACTAALATWERRLGR